MQIDDKHFDNSIYQLKHKLDEVLRLLKSKNRLDGKNILDNQDLCLMLNLSTRTLRRYRAIGILPYIQIGSKPFYYESDVQEFIKKHQQNDAPPEISTII